MVLMIMGSFPGIYAMNMTQNDNNGNIGENNNGTDGARTIYVANNGTDRNDGLTPQSPKRNIENALVVANSGDTIRLAPGIYQKNVQVTKNITLIGDIQDNTIIDGEILNSCNIYIAPGITVTIANLNLKNGKGQSYSGEASHNGGGIYNDGTLILENSTITNCTSCYGGGIDNHGTMTIRGVTIRNNNAEVAGGGIYSNGPVILENSTITNNTAQEYYGGGISSIGTMTIRRSTIANNHAAQEGGGICTGGESTIEDSTIRNNTAALGGGIFNSNLLYVYGSTITGNMARDGGGIYNYNNTISRAYIDDLTVIRNNAPNDFAGKPFIPA